jgi:putative oxidoreductase
MGSVAQGEEMTEMSNVQRPTSNPPLPGTGSAVASVQLSEGTSSSFRRRVWRVVAFIIGGIFVYAGALKAMEPLSFANDIENYHVLPWPIGIRLAFYLPWLEILCGLALITRRLYSGAVSILLGLMLVFIGATIAAKARGIDITCGCFGHASKNLSFTWHLVLDFAILAALIALWLSNAARRDRRD